MTVLLLAVQWPPETFIQRLADGLAASGIRVQVGVTKKPRRTTTDSAALDVVVLTIGWAAAAVKCVRRPIASTRLWRLIRVRRRETSLGSALREMRRYLPLVGLHPDVIHFQWNSSAIEYDLLNAVLRRPAVVSCRGAQVQVAPHNPRRRDAQVAGLRRTFEAAARIHCVSEAMQSEASLHGATPEKSVVVRPAVDASFFSPLPEIAARKPSDPLHVVTIGGLWWRKDHESALVAVRKLVDAGVPIALELIGEGPEKQWLQFTVRDLGIEAHVRFRGKASPEECRDRLRQAHVFVLSSVSEGISNAVLEAMACGVPVVTTDCGGMREAVSHGTNGLVVPVRDPDAIGDALKRLAADEALRQSMGRAARESIIERFTLERQIAAFRDLYRAVA